MENKPTIPLADISSTNTEEVYLSPIPAQTKTNFVLAILLTLLISGVVFCIIGFYLGVSKSKNNQQHIFEEQTNQIGKEPDLTQIPIEKQETKQIWNNYASKSMNVTFKFPQSWIVDESNLGEIRVQNFTIDSMGRGYDSNIDKDKILLIIYEWSTGENNTYLTPQSLGSLNGDCVASEEGNEQILQENEIKEGNLTIYYRQTKCSQAETGKITDSYYLFNGKGDVFKVVLAMYDNNSKDIVLDFLKTFNF